MKYEYKSSFDKTFQKLELNRKEKVIQAVSLLIDFFEFGKKAKGLGLKHLRGDFGEIRVDIRDRIIFTLEEDTVGFVIVGCHDEIKRFLKSI
jgi:mRNA-degrading endonuclease YafQ of YafQ-DinJ toxin-antitoxin module